MEKVEQEFETLSDICKYLYENGWTDGYEGISYLSTPVIQFQKDAVQKLEKLFTKLSTNDLKQKESLIEEVRNIVFSSSLSEAKKLIKLKRIFER